MNVQKNIVNCELTERKQFPVNVTESFSKINKQENQKPIVLHNQSEVLNPIDTDSLVENECPVTDQNIQSYNKNKTYEVNGVDALLGDCLDPSLDGRSKIHLVGKKRNWVFEPGSSLYQALRQHSS